MWSTNFWKQKVPWQHRAMSCLYVFLNLFYFTKLFLWKLLKIYQQCRPRNTFVFVPIRRHNYSFEFFPWIFSFVKIFASLCSTQRSPDWWFRTVGKWLGRQPNLMRDNSHTEIHPRNSSSSCKRYFFKYEFFVCKRQKYHSKWEKESL